MKYVVKKIYPSPELEWRIQNATWLIRREIVSLASPTLLRARQKLRARKRVGYARLGDSNDQPGSSRELPAIGKTIVKEAPAHGAPERDTSLKESGSQLAQFFRGSSVVSRRPPL